MDQNIALSQKLHEIKNSYAKVQELYNSLQEATVAKSESEHIIKNFRELITVMLTKIMSNSPAVKSVSSVNAAGGVVASAAIASDDAGNEVNDTIDAIIAGLSGVLNERFYADSHRFETVSDELCQLTNLSQSVLDVIGGTMYAPFTTGPCSGESRYTQLNDVLAVTKITYDAAVARYNAIKSDLDAMKDIANSAPGAFEALTGHYNSATAKPFNAALIKNLEAAISVVLNCIHKDNAVVDTCNKISETAGGNVQAAYGAMGAQEANNKQAFKDHFKSAFHSAPVIKQLIAAIQDTASKVHEFNNMLGFVQSTEAGKEYIDLAKTSDSYVTASLEACFKINNIPLMAMVAK